MPASAQNDPSPRQLLVTAQSMAAGMPESIASRLAGLHLEHVAQARQAMALDELLADCRTVEARPPAEQDETLTRLLRQSMQRALADDKIGAINAAMRLLGLGPASAPAETPAQPQKRKPASARRKEEAEPEQPAINPAEVWDRWRMRADHEGDWEGDDRRLVMPDRDVYVVPGAKGAVRLLDITPEQTNPEMLELLERMSEQETHDFNRLAYPAGGLQWDWRLRTLWFWEGPPPRPRPKAVKQGSRATPVAAPPPRSPHVALRARLERLLAQPAPSTADDLDLAEAICAQLWPNWPRYTGSIDGFVLRDVLAARPLVPPELNRLAGRRPGAGVS
jgi:hypothetical protein